MDVVALTGEMPETFPRSMWQELLEIGTKIQNNPRNNRTSALDRSWGHSWAWPHHSWKSSHWSSLPTWKKKRWKCQITCSWHQKTRNQFTNLNCFKMSFKAFYLAHVIETTKFTNSESPIQWNLDLRKILGVTKIFLESRFFLISNKRNSLITYINNRRYRVKYIIMYSSLSFW